MRPFNVARLILFFETVLASLWALVPDAYCDGCPPPDVPAWVWVALDRVQAILAALYALLGG